MSQPTSKVDERFSQENAVTTEWEVVRDVIEKADLFWITSVRANARPHVTPLVAVWMDDALHFSTGASEQKALNIMTNPHVILTTGCNGWESGMDVVVEGDALRVSDDETLRRLAEVWTTKWDGSWHYNVREGYFFHPGADDEDAEKILVYAVRPNKVLSFTKGAFNHTSHRF
jgi:nitroimidazol reductase NimA-like FMN-containing flavoprotein (pyridoxamine 5'-phosphate oxidase superfamily)